MTTPKKPNPTDIHTKHICDDGTVSDCAVETHYCRLETVGYEAGDDFLRVIADAGAVNYETRISFKTLESLGFTRKGAE